MLSAMLKTLEGKKTSIVFPEGNEPRVLNAAVRLYNDGYVTPVLLGNVEEVKAVAANEGVSVEGIEIIETDSKKINKEEGLYSPEFIEKVRKAEENIKNGETTTLNPDDIWGSLGLK